MTCNTPTITIMMMMRWYTNHPTLNHSLADGMKDMSSYRFVFMFCWEETYTHMRWLNQKVDNIIGSIPIIERIEYIGYISFFFIFGLKGLFLNDLIHNPSLSMLLNRGLGMLLMPFIRRFHIMKLAVKEMKLKCPWDINECEPAYR